MRLLNIAIERLLARAGAVPDPGTLVTANEIERVTGGAPDGPPRTNGAGSEVDGGRLLIWESKLSNGDKFLVTLITNDNRAEAELTMDRMAVECKPLPDVGERGLVRVKKYRKNGSSEVGVKALHGTYNLSLTHTSRSGETDAGPLTELLRTALTRIPV